MYGSNKKPRFYFAAHLIARNAGYLLHILHGN